MHIFFNDTIVESTSKLWNSQSPALRYGWGLFETIKYRNGNIIFLDDHYERLQAGLKMLQIAPTESIKNSEKITAHIHTLVQKNNLANNARIRIGVYANENSSASVSSDVVIEAEPLPYLNQWQLNNEGLQIDYFKTIKKENNALACYKHNNYLISMLAHQFAKQQSLDEAIILNNQNHIVETAFANIFIVKNNIIYTPNIASGCVAGIFRKNLLRQHTVIEQTITQHDVETADEVFITNSIQNIRWVASIGKKKYTNAYTADMCKSFAVKESLLVV